MSTWIFRRGILALVPVLGLTACLNPPAGGFGFHRRAPQTIAVAGDVVIGGPPGYCIDRAGSRLGRDTAFVLMGNCASVTRDYRADRPDEPGVLTASVARAVDATPASATWLNELEAFLTSPAGRAALARDGQEGSVEILQTTQDDGALLMRLRDVSASVLPGTDPVYWRGLIDLNGHLVTVSVVSFADRPLSDEAARRTLKAFLSRIRAETPVRPPEIQPEIELPPK